MTGAKQTGKKSKKLKFLMLAGFVLLIFSAAVFSTCVAQHHSEAEVPEASGWRKAVIVDGLEHPWGMAFISDSKILITERPGRLRMVENGILLEDNIGGVPAVFAEGQGGLLDVSLHPEFKKNNFVYLTYSAGSSNSNQTRLARGVLKGMELQEVEVIFKAEPEKSRSSHFGSRILWLPDNTMLVSIGDGGNPPLQIDGIPAREHGQRLKSHLASIIRLNADGSAPEDNPFLEQATAKPEIYSYGHRNIQGMARDPQSGRVWANEHGPYGGDELNLIYAGENYGWPKQTHGRDYRTRLRIGEKSVEGMHDPKVVWIPAQAPSGLAFYTGKHFPEWQGSLFSGGLVGQQIRRIILNGENVTGEEKLSINDRIRDVVQGPDGYLYVLTDKSNGELLRIEPI